MSGLVVETQPAREPLTVIEVRDALRLDDDVDETLVVSFIIAAREWAENYTGRALITRTIQQWLDGFIPVDMPLWEGWKTGPDIVNYQNHIELALAPAITVSDIKYYSDDDTETTWPSTNYYADTIREPARIVLRDGGSYPTQLRTANAIKITYTAGYGTTTQSVPEPIRIAMMQYCAFMYEHRGDGEGNVVPMPPKLLTQLLKPYQIIRFGSTPYKGMVRAGIG